MPLFKEMRYLIRAMNSVWSAYVLPRCLLRGHRGFCCEANKTAQVGLYENVPALFAKADVIENTKSCEIYSVFLPTCTAAMAVRTM
jgi:sulfopyruvate decarboxylase TPP-binding subunit